MKNFLIIITLFFGITAFAQVGIGTTDPEGVLDLVSTDGGIVIPRVANTAAVVNQKNTATTTFPIPDGTMVYDISASCIKAYEGGAWSACFSAGGGSKPARLATTGGALTDADLNGNVIYVGSTFSATFTLGTISNPQNGDTVTLSDVAAGTLTMTGQHVTARSAPAQNGGSVTYVYIEDSTTPANTGWYHTNSF